MDRKELLLTPEQRRDVETHAKDVVVLASPGGGKTALIVERIARLVLEEKVLPESIMALTFTSKSAIELRQRVHNKIGPVATELPHDIQVELTVYESILQKQNAIDLDDMIVKALELLDNPTIRS